MESQKEKYEEYIGILNSAIEKNENIDDFMKDLLTVKIIPATVRVLGDYVDKDRIEDLAENILANSSIKILDEEEFKEEFKEHTSRGFVALVENSYSPKVNAVDLFGGKELPELKDLFEFNGKMAMSDKDEDNILFSHIIHEFVHLFTSSSAPTLRQDGGLVKISGLFFETYVSENSQDEGNNTINELLDELISSEIYKECDFLDNYNKQNSYSWLPNVGLLLVNIMGSELLSPFANAKPFDAMDKFNRVAGPESWEDLSSSLDLYYNQLKENILKNFTRDGSKSGTENLILLLNKIKNDSELSSLRTNIQQNAERYYFNDLEAIIIEITSNKAGKPISIKNYINSINSFEACSIGETNTYEYRKKSLNELLTEKILGNDYLEAEKYQHFSALQILQDEFSIRKKQDRIAFLGESIDQTKEVNVKNVEFQSTEVFRTNNDINIPKRIICHNNIHKDEILYSLVEGQWTMTYKQTKLSFDQDLSKSEALTTEQQLVKKELYKNYGTKNKIVNWYKRKTGKANDVPEFYMPENCPDCVFVREKPDDSHFKIYQIENNEDKLTLFNELPLGEKHIIGKNSRVRSKSNLRDSSLPTQEAPNRSSSKEAPNTENIIPKRTVVENHGVKGNHGNTGNPHR